MPALHWLTRDADIHAAARVPYRLLEEAHDLSTGDPDAGNMLIQGDNLEALKALLPFYAGQVKCIYIDPPYNTRSAFEQYEALLHESYRVYRFRLLFLCQLIFSTLYDWGLPTWIIRLRMAQPKRLSTCWFSQLRAFSLSPMRCL